MKCAPTRPSYAVNWQRCDKSRPFPGIQRQRGLPTLGSQFPATRALKGRTRDLTIRMVRRSVLAFKVASCQDGQGGMTP